jgi:hypothetical protein
MAEPEVEVRSFIRRLALGTRQGNVSWTAKSDAEFEVDTGSANVTVRSEASDSLDHPYVFEIRNADRETLVAVKTLAGEYYNDWEDEMAGLYKAARNQALGVDRALRDLTKTLHLPEIADPDIPF